MVAVELAELETVVGDLVEELRACCGKGGMAQMDPHARAAYEAGLAFLTRVRREARNG